MFTALIMTLSCILDRSIWHLPYYGTVLRTGVIILKVNSFICKYTGEGRPQMMNVQYLGIKAVPCNAINGIFFRSRLSTSPSHIQWSSLLIYLTSPQQNAASGTPLRSTSLHKIQQASSVDSRYDNPLNLLTIIFPALSILLRASLLISPAPVN